MKMFDKYEIVYPSAINLSSKNVFIKLIPRKAHTYDGGRSLVN